MTYGVVKTVQVYMGFRSLYMCAKKEYYPILQDGLGVKLIHLSNRIEGLPGRAQLVRRE